MRTEKHWEECLHEESYLFAQQVQMQLREIAKASGYDPRGVILHSKKEAIKLNIGRINAYITWDEGPEDWLEMCELPTSMCSQYRGSMLLFYA